MLWRDSRGKPKNAPAAFIHRSGMSKLSFAFNSILMILAVILAAGVITLIVISLIPTIGFGAKSILFTMIVIVLGLILIVKTVR
jgi:hypothetical protein